MDLVRVDIVFDTMCMLLLTFPAAAVLVVQFNISFYRGTLQFFRFLDRLHTGCTVL
jgi:hypothetical protein